MAETALKPVQIQPSPEPGAVLEDVIIKGDLAKLSPEMRARYYVSFCQSVGLNPQTQPLAYITLNNKLTLYALKGATDQLRRVYGVSVVRVDKEIVDDLYVVTVAVRDASGRTDEDMGAALIAGLKGDAKINAMLKAITKAKRRATLSLCGLGLLDETETESIPGAQIVPVDTETGVILEAESSEQTPVKATTDQIQKLHGEGKGRGLDHDDLHALAGLKGYASIAEMTGDQIQTMTTWLKSVRPAELDVYLKKAGRPTIDERLAAAK